MKREIFILLGLILVSSFSFGQCELPTIDGKYGYEEIISVDDSFSKDQIYDAASIALTKTFITAKSAIDVKNREGGYIVSKGVINTKPHMMGQWQSTFAFSVRLDFKDGKYKILLTYMGHEANSKTSICQCPNDLTSEKCGASCLSKAQWAKQKCEANEKILNAIDEIKINIENNLADSGW